MEKIKIILPILTAFLLSGCYFLENLIPEDWYADQEINNYQNTVLIYRPAGIQCEGNFFHSLEGAVAYLENRGIPVYDSFESADDVFIECGYPTPLTYYVLIDSDWYGIANYYGWREYIPQNSYRNEVSLYNE